MGNKKSAAGCQMPEEPTGQKPTVRQVAQRLLTALARIDAGGDPEGIELGEARHELSVLLASTPSATMLLTGADFDPEAFERIWRSTAVQAAGTHYGWRGVAEAVWAAALDEARSGGTIVARERP
ncbi:hypothetical protein [Cupriavidus sp. YAF13]|uniref:hypothetical protein n=1 Tax=Cupriavidus sp. YAF13 TaxID=3233075 RepID=UPI003F93ABFF